MTAGCSVYTGLQCGECWEGDATGVRVIVGRRLLLSSKWSLEKAVAPHSSTLAWKIPWMEAPGRLQSMGSLRVGHDWATSLSLFTFMHWRRKWQPTPVFLPGESQGRRSLVGCCLWGCTESDTTKWLSSSSSKWSQGPHCIGCKEAWSMSERPPQCGERRRQI